MGKSKLTVIGSNDADQEIEEIVNSLRAFYHSEEEAAFFSEKVVFKRVTKGALLLREGQLVKSSFHLFKGCVREYYLRDGEEKTISFYTEGDSLSDDQKKYTQAASTVSWQCVTDCIVSVFQFEDEKEMYKRFPRIESACRIENEKQYAQYKNAMHQYLASSPEERYEHLLTTKPELFQLVPLYHIASYLGVKPESLSRIRNRLRAS